MINKLLELNNWGIINIFGHDTQTFLQGQLTNDVTKITESKGQLSAYCNSKGRIISVFIIFKYQQGYGLFLPKNNIPLVLKNLHKYGHFSKITSQDLTSSYLIIGCLDNTRSDFYSLQYHLNKDLFSLKLPGNRKIFIAEKISLEKLSKEVIALNKSFQPPIKLTTNIWNSIDIKEKIPFLDTSLQEKLLAHPLNLVDLNAISFSKGCYMGQEIIARSQYKGVIKKHARALIINSDHIMNNGDKIYLESEEIGLIINYIKTKPSYYLALIIIKDRIFKILEKNDLQLKLNNEQINVQVS